jgi:hypothetical protein
MNRDRKEYYKQYYETNKEAILLVKKTVLRLIVKRTKKSLKKNERSITSKTEIKFLSEQSRTKKSLTERTQWKI